MAMVLTPISNVYLVTTLGVDELESDHIEIDNVGCKAFGLCTLPIEWRPNFFVISSDLFTSENIQNREQFILFIADALLKSNLKDDLPPASHTKVMAVSPQILENCGYEDHTIYR
jgi:hypothetical protein